MGQALGEVLPAAAGVALSPVPIIAVVLMLGTPRARSNGPAFAIGWVLGLVAASLLVYAVASGSDDPDSGTSMAVDIVMLVVGLLFLAMVPKQWKARPTAGQPPVMPTWMSSVDHFTPLRSLGLGVLLSAANPKNLALTAAAASSVTEAGLDGVASAEVIATFVILASLTVGGPVLFLLVAGDAATKPLASVKDFMTQYNPVIMLVILLVLGAKLVGDGIAGLTA